MKNRHAIVAAFANRYTVSGKEFLKSLGKENRAIDQAIAPAKDHCDYSSLSDATLDAIREKLQSVRDELVIFHFAGHANGIDLLLENESGGQHAADGELFAQFLSDFPKLQMVVLNACNTQQHAMRLVQLSVPLVIATTRAVEDDLAASFSTMLYSGIAKGMSIEQAFRDASNIGRSLLLGDTDTDRALGAKDRSDNAFSESWPWQLYPRDVSQKARSWNLPSACGDPLFGLAPRESVTLTPEPFRKLRPFKKNDYPIFFGRNTEIREIVTKLLDPGGSPILMLHGQSGAGKSSLLEAGVIPFLESTAEERSKKTHNRTADVLVRRCQRGSRMTDDLCSLLNCSVEPGPSNTTIEFETAGGGKVPIEALLDPNEYPEQDMLVLNLAWKMTQAAGAKEFDSTRSGSPKLVFVKPGFFVTTDPSFGRRVAKLSSNHYQSGKFGRRVTQSEFKVQQIRKNFLKSYSLDGRRRYTGKADHDAILEHLKQQIVQESPELLTNIAASVGSDQAFSYLRNFDGRMLPESVAQPGSWAAKNLRWRVRFEVSEKAGASTTPQQRFSSDDELIRIHSYLILESAHDQSSRLKIGPIAESRFSATPGLKGYVSARPGPDDVVPLDADTVDDFDVAETLHRIASRSSLCQQVELVHWNAVEALYVNAEAYKTDRRSFGPK